MFVCSCNLITCEDIRHAVASIRAASPDAPLNATVIYKALGKRPRCGNCLELADEQVCAFARTGDCCRQPAADRPAPASTGRRARIPTAA
jgi:bacterioferritin-associated ferredoxin